jgi:glycosyltransferase involved in cell wall biosynthesis
MIKNIHPTISVIIPTYNRSKLLGRAIQSVIDQTFADFELIVVDDASTDNTYEVVSAFEDQRIRFIRHEQNRGVSVARNTGLDAVLGDYITFLDSDDEWLPQKLERQWQAFQSSCSKKPGAVSCAAWLMTGKSAKLVHMRVDDDFYGDLLSFVNTRYCSMTNLMIDKQVLQRHNIKFDEALRTVGDRDFVLRLVRVCKMDYVNEALTKFNTDAAVRLTHKTNSSERLKCRLILLDKYKRELKHMPKALARHHVSIALLYLRNGDFGSARTHFQIAARTYSSPKYLLFWMVSLAGSKSFLVFHRMWEALSVLAHKAYRKT